MRFGWLKLSGGEKEGKVYPADVVLVKLINMKKGENGENSIDLDIEGRTNGKMSNEVIISTKNGKEKKMIQTSEPGCFGGMSKERQRPINIRLQYKHHLLMIINININIHLQYKESTIGQINVND